MRTKDREIEERAVAFAIKFGFLTREIFFEFLCPRQQTQKYEYWNYLRLSGLFVCAKKDETVYYLSKKRAAFSPDRVKRRYFYHIDHDSVAARLDLLLERSVHPFQSWTEMQLRTDPQSAVQILGCGDISKLPDLVVDLPSQHGCFRVAFEIEATAKSRERYRQAAFSYLTMMNVNLVVYVCNGINLERVIDAAFTGELFQKKEKRPALLQTGDFERDGLDARTRFLEQQMTLRELIATATGVSKAA